MTHKILHNQIDLEVAQLPKTQKVITWSSSSNRKRPNEKEQFNMQIFLELEQFATCCSIGTGEACVQSGEVELSGFAEHKKNSKAKPTAT